MVIAVPAFAALIFAFHKYEEGRPPSHLIVLIARFAGPDQARYQVTDLLVAAVRSAVASYSDVEVQTLNDPITEQDPGVAASRGRARKATIVLWGEYAVTTQKVAVTTHLQILRQRDLFPSLPPRLQGQPQILPLAALTNFKVQTNLADQLTVLSLTVAGFTRYEAQDWPGVISRLGTALRHARGRLSRSLAPALYLARGNAYQELRKDQAAEDDYDRAIAGDSGLVEAYLSRGTLLLIEGENTQGLADFATAVRLAPHQPYPYLGRGTAYLRLKQYTRAIADLGHALSLDPTLEQAYEARALAYSGAGDTTHALADVNRLLRRGRDLARAYAIRGSIYAAVGNDEAAREDLDRAIRLEPKNAQFYIDRGTVDPTDRRSIDDFTKAIHLNPHAARAYLHRGAIYANTKRYDFALRDLNAAVRIDPTLAAAYLFRGYAHELRGEQAAAIADYRRVLEISPDPKLRGAAHAALKSLGRAS